MSLLLSLLDPPPAPPAVLSRTLLGVGLSVLLALMPPLIKPVPAQETTGCGTMFWGVRLTYEAAPGTWSQTGIGPHDNTDRAAAMALRDEVLAHGWVWPQLIAGEPNPMLRGETRVAPAAIRFASVKRSCCRMDLPPTERPPCTWPDGDPPPAP